MAPAVAAFVHAIAGDTWRTLDPVSASEWASADSSLAGKWNQLALDWHSFYEEQGDLDEAQIRKRIALLHKEAVSIENDEDQSRFDRLVMKDAVGLEKMYQGVVSTYDLQSQSLTWTHWFCIAVGVRISGIEQQRFTGRRHDQRRRSALDVDPVDLQIPRLPAVLRPHWADGGSATDTLPCYGAARDVVILPKAPSLISRRNLILSL